MAAGIPWQQKVRAYESPVTPETAAWAVQAASHDSRYVRRLYETMLSSDAELAAAVSLRLASVLNAEWTLSDAAGNEVPLPDKWSHAVRHLAMAPLLGFAAVEVVWGKNWVPKELVPWPHAAIYERGGTVYLVTSGGREIEAASVADRLCLVLADPVDPSGAAILRPLVAGWLERLYLRRDWRRYVERYADPLVVARPPSDAGEMDGEHPVMALARAIESAKRSGSTIAVSAGTEVDVLSDQRGDATAAFDGLLRRSLEEMYRAVLGDAEVALGGRYGTRASTEVRYRQLESIAESDCALLQEALQRQVFDRAGLRLSYTWSRELGALDKAKLYLAAQQAGIPFDPVGAAEELGLALKHTQEMQSAATLQYRKLHQLTRGQRRTQSRRTPSQELAEATGGASAMLADLMRGWAEAVAERAAKAGTPAEALDVLKLERNANPKVVEALERVVWHIAATAVQDAEAEVRGLLSRGRSNAG